MKGTFMGPLLMKGTFITPVAATSTLTERS